MPRYCQTFHGPDGRPMAIVCGTRERTPKCACGGRSAFQCDFPLRGSATGRTCSRHLCNACVRRHDGGLDYCETHHQKLRAEREREEQRTPELAPEPSADAQLGLGLGGG